MAVLRDAASFRSYVLLPQTLDGWTYGRTSGGLVVIRCGQTETGCGRRCRTRQSDHRPLAVSFLIGGDLGEENACQLRLNINHGPRSIFSP